MLPLLIDAPDIRTAAIGDADAIATLVNLAYGGRGAVPGWTSEAAIFNGDRIELSEILELLRDPQVTFLLRFDGADLVGGVYVRALGSVAYVGLLAVRPEWQDGGIGKELIAAAERLARRWLCTRVEITVMTSHRPELTAFYERRGYKRTGRFRPPLRKTATLDAKVVGLRLEWMEKTLGR